MTIKAPVDIYSSKLNPIEKARISDVTQMHELINYFADKDE
ncbi:unnamed protein product, partial [marine sediment metagenome]